MIYLVVKRKIGEETYTVRFAVVEKEKADSFAMWSNHDNREYNMVYEVIEQYVT